MMDAAANINDLRQLPANHLEKLEGDRLGQYSITINKQYRICFKCEIPNNFYNIEIVDYH